MRTFLRRPNLDVTSLDALCAQRHHEHVTATKRSNWTIPGPWVRKAKPRNLSLTDQAWAWLSAQAEQLGVSRSGVIERLASDDETTRGKRP